MTRQHARALAAVGVAAAVVILAAGCASTSDAASNKAIEDVIPPTTVTTAAAATTATTVAPKDPTWPDADPTLSYRPQGPVPAPGQMPPGSAMAKVLDRGHVTIGVDENTIGFSYRDPDTGALVGFEADLARAVGRALFGSDVPVRLVTLTTPEKIAKVKSGDVDMTISVVTISCTRRADVDFSTPYYAAFQQLMVRSDSKIAGQGDLSGKRVCVTTGSSSESFLKSVVPDARRRPVDTRTECLTRLQEGKVDAIVLPSSIMAGLARQDPTMTVFPNPLVNSQGAAANNIYGIAVGKTANHEFARYLNGLLEQWRADGTLDRLQVENIEHGFPYDPTKPAPPASYED